MGSRLILAWLALIGLHLSAPADPRHVYLTWRGDTSTTITVNYQTMLDSPTSTVYYDTRPRREKTNDYRFCATGTGHKIEGLEDGRTIHWVELWPLKPATTYYFIAGDPTNGFTAERKFQTMPDGDQKVRFVIGGDMGTGPALPVLLRQAALQEPGFGVVGGDIAYANDRLTNYTRWDTWLDAWEHSMITPKGFTVPMVLAIGNHEVGYRPDGSSNAVFYLQYFAQECGGTTYFSRKFGKNFVLYLLDSGHMAPYGPEQARWLDAQLEADRNVPFRFAVYHVGLYPAYRPYEAHAATARSAWLSTFDQHHLTAAFEHHDHVYKRTKLLRDGRVDPNGTLYLGDGCWGQGARPVGKVRRWYEAKAASIQHFWLVQVSRKGVEYRAIDKEGQVFDVYPEDAAGADAAEKVYRKLIH